MSPSGRDLVRARTSIVGALTEADTAGGGGHWFPWAQTTLPFQGESMLLGPVLRSCWHFKKLGLLWKLLDVETCDVFARADA